MKAPILRNVATLALSILLATPQVACSQSAKPAAAPATPTKSGLTMDRSEGTSIQTVLSPNIVLNKGSGLKREWFVVRDAAAPATIEAAAGVTVTYKSGERYSSGEYQYKSNYVVTTSEPLTAVEVRAQVFDVFGRHLKTLSATEVADLDGKVPLSGAWRIFSENEASEAYTSVMYVAQARTASGKVYAINSSNLLEQLRKVASKITEADIEPKKAEK